MSTSIDCELIDIVLKREEILELICQEQPDKRDLVDTLPYSRPTIDRAIRELEDHEMVQREDGVCKPTYLGEVAYDLCTEFEDAFEIVQSARTGLASLSPDSDLPGEIFVRASVFQTSEYAPFERIEPMYKDFKNADSIRGATEVLFPPYLKQILSHCTRGAVDVDLVITPKVLDILLENAWETAVSSIESGDTMYKSRGLNEYSLFLLDDEVLYVVLYSDTSYPTRVIQNTTPRAIQWADSRLEEFKKNAELLTS